MRNKRENRKQSSYLTQGGLPAIIFFAVNCCILIRQIPLMQRFSEHGGNYYSAVFETVLFLWFLSSFGIGKGVENLTAFSLKQNQYMNVGKIIYHAFVWVIAGGVLTGCLSFFGSSLIAENILLEPDSAIILKCMAPACLLFGLNGILRGFFRGSNMAFPDAFSRLLEQGVFLITCFPFLPLYSKYGSAVGNLLQNKDFQAVYCVIGAMFAILAGSLVSCLFLLFLYFPVNSYLKKQMNSSMKSSRYSSMQVAKGLFIDFLPALAGAVLFRGYLFVDQIFFHQFMNGSMSISEIADQWGTYYGKYKVISTLPVVFAIGMCGAVIPSIRKMIKKDVSYRMKDYIHSVTHCTLVVIIPMSVFLGVTSSLFMNCFYPGQNNELAAGLVITGVVSGVFYGVAFIMCNTLIGIRKEPMMLLCSFAAFALHIGALYLFLEQLELDIYGVLYADIIYSFCLCFFLYLAVRKKCKAYFGILRTSLPIFISSGIMGVILFILDKALRETISSAGLLVICFLTGSFAYLVLLLCLHGVTEKQLERIPGGKCIRHLARAVRLLS